MPISKQSIKNLLSFLDKKYPDAIESHEQLSSLEINSEELFKVLFFCYEEKLVDCTFHEELTSGKIIDSKHIRITGKGILFLEGQ